MTVYELKLNLPYLRKGRRYIFDYEHSRVFIVNKSGKISPHHVEQGLAGYLWLLKKQQEKYLRRLEI